MIFFNFNSNPNDGNNPIFEVIGGFIGGILISVAGLMFVKRIGLPTTKDIVIDSVKRDFNTGSLKNIDLSAITDQNKIKLQKTYCKIENEPYLLKKNFIHRREMACIASDAGVGKTLLANYIAKENPQLKTLFFSLDDQSNDQLYRLLSIPKEYIITHKFFHQSLEKLISSAKNECQKMAVISNIIDRGMKNIIISPAIIEEKRNRLEKDLGINDRRKVDEILLFELIAESEEFSNVDIVILDSLNALLGYESKIQRRCMERIIKIFKERGQTFIILHHTNKKNEIAGSSSLGQVLDTVLLLEKYSDNIRRIELKKGRFKQGANECYLKMISCKNGSVDFELTEKPANEVDNRSPMEIKILKALENTSCISFEELIGICQSTQNGIKNTLKKLEDAGFLTKADGKTWRVIKRC